MGVRVEVRDPQTARYPQGEHHHHQGPPRQRPGGSLARLRDQTVPLAAPFAMACPSQLGAEPRTPHAFAGFARWTDHHRRLRTIHLVSVREFGEAWGTKGYGRSWGEEHHSTPPPIVQPSHLGYHG